MSKRKKGPTSTENFAGRIVNQCNRMGIEAFIFHKATTGSTYIRFGDQRMASIRLGDHPGRERYRYKFNVRKDMKHFFREEDNGIVRFYVPMTDLGFKQLMKLIKQRWEVSRDWPQQYEYNPKPDFDRINALKRRENVW